MTNECSYFKNADFPHVDGDVIHLLNIHVSADSFNQCM